MLFEIRQSVFFHMLEYFSSNSKLPQIDVKFSASVWFLYSKFLFPYYKCAWQNLINLMVIAVLPINTVTVSLGNRQYFINFEYHIIHNHHDFRKKCSVADQ